MKKFRNRKLDANERVRTISSRLLSTRGLTIIEIVIALGITAIAFVGASKSLEIAGNHWARSQTKLALLDKRNELITVLEQPGAIEKSLSHPTNEKTFSCLNNDPIDCLRSVEFSKFNLFDDQENLVIDSLNTTVGSRSDLSEQCETYSKVGNNNNCPIKLNIFWKPFCDTPCTNPLLLIEYRPEANFSANSSKFNLKMSEFGLRKMLRFRPASAPAVFLGYNARGYFHLESDGKLKAIGRNNFSASSHSKLAVGTTAIFVSSLTSVKDQYLNDVTDVRGIGTIGSSHICVIIGDDRHLHCGGENLNGDLGIGSYLPTTHLVPSIFTDGSPVDQIDWVKHARAGGNVVKSLSGEFYFFGSNAFNRYAHDNLPSFTGADYNGDADFSRVSKSPLLDNLKSILQVHEVTINDRSACAKVDVDRSVTCWGSYQRGKMGDNGFADSLGDAGGSTIPIAVPSPDTERRVKLRRSDGTIVRLQNVQRLYAANRVYCAVLGTPNLGNIACWGAGDLGLLGDGAMDDNDVAAFVLRPDGTPLDGIESVQMSWDHICAMGAEGSIEVNCWGQNQDYQLGRGYSSNEGLFAEPMVGITLPVKRVAPTVEATCIQYTNDKISCLGKNVGLKFGAGTNGSVYSDWIDAFQ